MITLTSQAATKVKEAIAKRGAGLGLKVGVKTTGCSGMSYVLEFIDALDPLNEEYKCHDVSIFVTVKDLVYLDGMNIDWVKKGLNEGFEFFNPKESSRCGCGESFKI